MSVHTTPAPQKSEPAPFEDRPIRFGLRSLFVVIAVCAILCGVWAMVLRIQHHQRDQASRLAMKIVLYGIQNHEDMRGDLPPPFFVDPSGKPINSWRTITATCCDSGPNTPVPWQITNPWDHPSNREMRQSYYAGYFWLPTSGQDKHGGKTCVLAVTGPNTGFPTTPLVPAHRRYRGVMTMDDITDGLENTILIVEVADSDVHWMEPRDLGIETMSFRINDESKPGLCSDHPDGPLVGFADGEVFRVSRDIPPETLRALLTATGGEDIDRDDLVRQGYLK